MKRKKPKEWQGCYQDSWKGHITAASYAHPAKFAKGLVERILDYMNSRGWIEKGDVIGDPFGGVGTGGIVAAYRGYRWVGVELEPKFATLAMDNFMMHAGKLFRLRAPVPVMALGDSRRFHERLVEVAAILSSPPYVSGGHHTDAMEGGNKNGRGQTRRPIPQTAAQVGLLGGEQLTNQTSAIVTSPPYADSLDAGGPEKQHPDGWPRSNDWTGYGKTDGQIARLKSGEVDAVVGSPPFAGSRAGRGIVIEGHNDESRPSSKTIGARIYQGRGGDRDPANIEALETGKVNAVISSPPYETIHAGAGGLNHLPAREGQQGGRKMGASQKAMEHSQAKYGDTPGQIAKAKKGSVDAFISSPPYADSINSDSHGIDFGKAKPDYPGRRNHPARNKAHADAATNMRYGDTPGQIGALKAVVSSPPWEKNVEGGRRKGKFKGDAVLKSKRGKGASDAAVLAQAERDEQKTLGDSPGQIGQLPSKAPASRFDHLPTETYWQAVAKVYHSCFLALKPGGYMALVVKDFCKDKKRMPLCSDTMRLLVWLGFEEVERIHAMLTEEAIHHDLFLGETAKKKERKSFFRRNYEKGMAPDDPRRIDFEEVLIVRKPL